MEGKIKSIDVVAQSGLATINFEDGSKVHIESGYGLRQISGVAEQYGIESVIGQTIEYEKNDYNIMTSFDFMGGE